MLYQVESGAGSDDTGDEDKNLVDKGFEFFQGLTELELTLIIVVGCLALLLIISWACCCCSRSKRKKADKRSKDGDSNKGIVDKSKSDSPAAKLDDYDEETTPLVKSLKQIHSAVEVSNLQN